MCVVPTLALISQFNDFPKNRQICNRINKFICFHINTSFVLYIIPARLPVQSSKSNNEIEIQWMFKFYVSCVSNTICLLLKGVRLAYSP